MNFSKPTPGRGKRHSVTEEQGLLDLQRRSASDLRQRKARSPRLEKLRVDLNNPRE